MHDTFLSVIEKFKKAFFEAVRFGRFTMPNPSHRKNYDVLFNFHTSEFGEFNGERISQEWIYSGFENDSLALQINDFSGSNNFNMDFDFHCDVFEPAMRGQAIQHFLQTLHEFFKNPAKPLREVSLLSDEEKKRIFVDFNSKTEEYPRDIDFFSIFEQQVQKTPDKIALVWKDEYITFRDLNAEAARLAGFLQSLSEEKLKTSMAGLMFNPSPRLIVAILGALKSGMAILPVDPLHPDERIRFMLEDSRVELLLTEKKHLTKVTRIKKQCLCLKEIVCPEKISGELNERNNFAFSDRSNYIYCTSFQSTESYKDNAAYVIYTSGSTGKPKGVSVSRRNLVPLMIWSKKYFQLNENTNVLQNLNYSFDFGLFEIFTTLFFGGTLHFLDKEEISDLSEYGDYIQERGINTIHTTPSFFSNILTSTRSLKNLKTVHLGGEALNAGLVNQIYNQIPAEAKIFNGYGPTEATINCSIFEISGPTLCSDNSSVSIPVGKPSANNKIYIIDENFDLLPIGISGELAVGGDGVTMGYPGLPQLTAEKFIPDPFGKPGSRLYRTGDLARYLPDGNIEFLGRIDQQVKIRGFRIELGEIENILVQHPDIKDAVVTVHEKTNQVKYLVAYIIPAANHSPSAEEMREYLQQKLPEYMIPAVFLPLKNLPLNANGKVDRRALPHPEITVQEKMTVAPRTEIEEELVQIWKEVLGTEKIGIYDNFFELGGDSMKSIQIVARAARSGIRLSPVQFFNHNHIAALAKVAEKTETAHPEKEHTAGSIPLTPIQHIFFEKANTEPHHWNWSFLRELPQGLDLTLIKESISHLYRRHDALRLRFRQENGEWIQFIEEESGQIPFSVIDLSEFNPELQKQYLEKTTAALQGSLDLTNGPLMRIVYFDLGQFNNHRIFILFHHLIVDVISSRILLEDFLQIYHQLKENQRVHLLPPGTSFQYWSQFLTEYAQSAELRHEVEYWTDMLGEWRGAPIPRDYPDGINIESSNDFLITKLTKEETGKILQGSHLATVQEFLLTALTISFKNWTGHEQLLLALEGHGREYWWQGIDLSRTVGWFTSMYPVLLEAESWTFSDVTLERVKNRLRTIPNRGIGFGILKYLCQYSKVRDQMAQLPEAEINFNYLGQLDQRLSKSVPFKTAPENRGPERSLKSHRGFVLYVVASTRGGVLRIHWNFSRNLHRQSTIRKLADNFMDELRNLITHLYTIPISKN